MKSSIKAVAILIFLLGFIFNQQTRGQENQNYFSFDEILTKLTSASSNEKSLAEINAQLIENVQKRKVDFILSSEKEKYLKKVGASELLIKSLGNNLSKEKEDLIIEQKNLYKKFTDNYASKDIEQLKIAIEAGKEFVRKYDNDESVKEIIDYFVKTIPILKAAINLCDPETRRNYLKFDEALKTKRWNYLFEIGTEILKKDPEFIDVILVFASVGFDNATKEADYEHLNQTLYYAEKAIELLERNEASKTGDYGVLQYFYRNKGFPDGKANALGYMNYIIGYINYFYLNHKDEAVPYFQKSLQYKSKANELIRQLNLDTSK